MKQIIQNLDNGKTELLSVPKPYCNSKSVLIKTTRSLVSLGTEKMLVDFGKSSLIQKARKQPDKVKEVFAKVKTDGLSATASAVKNKLNQPIPLGYCNVGVVIEVGSEVSNFKIGDRVVSNGPHSEIVVVPKNLVVKIPDNVNDEEATFTVIGAIGLQGVRLIGPTFGETIVVIGLGLIGLITAQILKANGCNVIGFDYEKSKVDLAIKLGIDAVNLSNNSKQVEYVLQKTNLVGADGIIITASNSSNQIISNCAQMSRKRGRIVLVGVIGLDIKRADFYKKELSFQVSCSYGPGRYDDAYEQEGVDYPFSFVRWTENRNFSAVLSAISKNQIKVKDLISELVPFESFSKIYDNLDNSKSIASILTYSQDCTPQPNVVVTKDISFDPKEPLLGIIGAGNFTSSTILPKLNALRAQIKTVASAKGLSGSLLAKKYRIPLSTTEYKSIIDDEEINTVLITTKHGSHAKFVTEALENGKFVFVEKPLTTNWEGLKKIETAIKQTNGWVTVGFNRRFSKFSIELKKRISNSPVNIVATMNAGFIPPEVWVHDLASGGGRIIGEACHFIDLCSFLTQSRVVKVCMNSMGINPSVNTDNGSILLKYENGSNAVINYFSNGSKLYPKERIELYQENSTYVIDNWKSLRGYGDANFKPKKSKQDKGHKNQFKVFLNHISEAKGPTISWPVLLNTTKATLSAVDSLIEGTWIDVD